MEGDTALDAHGRLGVSGLQQQGKLITTKTKCQIGTTYATGQYFSKVGQHLITNWMAMGIVDLFKMIQIQQ